MKNKIALLFVAVLFAAPATTLAYGGTVPPAFFTNGPIMHVCFGSTQKPEHTNVECIKMKKRAVLIQLHAQLEAMMQQLHALRRR